MNKKTHHGHRGGAVAGRGTTRSTGSEVRAALWLMRHPGWVLVPAFGVWALAVWGAAAVAVMTGVVVLGVLAWWRAHPPTYDRWIAPWVRRVWRRWTVYRGRRWAAVLEDCELTRDNRRTGHVLVPRVLRVRSATPSIDTLTVRIVRGQDPTHWMERSAALADALGAHQVAVSRTRPGVVTVIVERRMPFDRVIDAPPIPDTSAEVDLKALDVGDNEYGQPFTIRIRGKHLLVVGASGAGKGSLLWGPLRQMGPLIRDGLVRLSVVDLKGGTETDRGEPLFYRWATTIDDAVALLTEFRDSMVERQAWMREHGVRSCEITADTPYELLIIDELAMLTAYGDRTSVNKALRLLAEVLTQGRAADHSVAGYLQEPTKDVVDVRDLFTIKVCLGVTAASHVDMALGEGARDRGALADQIPGDEAHAGIGFVIDAGSRLPVRFRAGYVSDEEIDELVARCTPATSQNDPQGGPGEVLPFPTQHDSEEHDTDDSDEDGQEHAS